MPFFSSLKIYLIGTFYGSVTPGRAGEVSRSFFMGDKKSKTIPTVVIDRVIDIICPLALSVISVVVFFNSIMLSAILVLLVIVFAVCTIALLHRGAVSRIFSLLKIEDEHREDYLSTVDATIRDRRALAYAFGLTLCYYAVNTLAFWLILQGAERHDRSGDRPGTAGHYHHGQRAYLHIRAGRERAGQRHRILHVQQHCCVWLLGIARPVPVDKPDARLSRPDIHAGRSTIVWNRKTGTIRNIRVRIP